MKFLPSAESGVLIYFTNKHHKEGQEDLTADCLSAGGEEDLT